MTAQKDKNHKPMALSGNHGLEYLDYVPVPLLILNRDLYILYYNQEFANHINLSFEKELGEVRPGDALNCLYAHLGPDGCGSSRFCSYCDVLETITKSIKKDSSATHEALHLQMVEGKIKAIDYIIKSTPFICNNDKCYMITLVDISKEKWHLIIENLVFHNVFEAVKSSFGLLNLIHAESSTDLRDNINLLKKVQSYIADEIEFYKIVREVETCKYKSSIDNIKVSTVIDHAVNKLRQHLSSSEKTIELGNLIEDVLIATDKKLLQWVLISILRNALEATPDKGTVKISCRSVDEEIVFEIHNDQVMDMDVQLQLFKRSFSTKGKFRGIGAYAAKVIVENYLGGKVEFTSKDKAGTVFVISLKTTA